MLPFVIAAPGSHSVLIGGGLQPVSDNGPQFVSTELKNFMSLNGIKHNIVAPYQTDW